jgi:hypothetical protein
MICSPYKKEVCFVADRGNQVIRYIDGVQSIHGQKVVGTLKMHGIPKIWRPEGITVVDSNALAITEGASLFLLKLDESLICGQLISVINNLQCPKGLCCNPGKDDAVLVAYGNLVKEVNLESKNISIIAQGFQQASDVAASVNGQIRATDVNSHTLTILSWDSLRAADRN